MIRRLSDFIFILLFVWACMFLGLWVINTFIVPFELHGIADTIVTGILKASVSTALVLFWLWAWREIVRRIFWRAIGEQQFIDQTSNNVSETDMPNQTEASEAKRRDKP
jgi:hypothetical protein